jgi:hypothetical protein
MMPAVRRSPLAPALVALALVAVMIGGCASRTPAASRNAAPTTSSAEPAPPADPLPKGSHALHHEERLQSSCGGKCTLRERAQSDIALRFEAHGDVQVEARGSHAERFESVIGTRNERIDWTRHWNGSWRQRGSRLRLSLVPDEPSCTAESASDVDQTTCGPIALELSCEPRRVVVRGKPASTELSWVCDLVKGINMPDTLTPFPWVFGMQRPLTARDSGPDHDPKRLYVLLNPPKPEATER